MASIAHIQRSCVVAAAAVALCYGLAYFDHPLFWGVNFHTYLPIWVPIVAILAIWGLTWANEKYAQRLPLAEGSRLRRVPSWTWAGLAALLMGLLFHTCLITTDLYGDSRVILSSLGQGGRDAGRYSLLSALNPNIFSSKNGEQFTYSLAVGLSKLLNMKIQASFKLLATGLGMIWVYAWVWFVLRRMQTQSMRLLGIALGLSAGITQVFYGHVEVYAAPVLAFTLYLMALVEWLDGRQRGWMAALTLLLLLSIRTHSAGFALVPTYVYALAAYWAGDHATRQSWLSWKRLGSYILALAFLGGLVGYFGIFQAGHESAPLTAATRSAFLTLLGDETADNRYAMFSRAHLWDFGQEMLLSGAIGTVLLLGLLSYRFRKGAWGRPAEVGATLALLLFGGLIFAIDPALSMPRDWDLCGLAAPALLVVGLLFLQRIEAQGTLGSVPMGLLLAIGGLQLTFIPLNHQPKPLHLRIIDLGNRAFQSKHTGSSFIVRNALDHPAFTPQERALLLQQEVDAWKQAIDPFNQVEIGYLSLNLAKMKFEAKDYAQAATYYALTAKATPNDVFVHEDLAVTYFYLQDWPACLASAQKAIDLKAQKSTAWRLAFIATQQLGQPQLALQVGRDMLMRFGDENGFAAEVAALEQQLGMPQ